MDRIVRCGAPGTAISQSTDGTCWTRETVTRLLVLHAATSVARRSSGGGKPDLPSKVALTPNELRIRCGTEAAAGKIDFVSPTLRPALLFSVMRFLGPIVLQYHVEGRGRAHVPKVVVFGQIPAGVPLAKEIRCLTRREPRLARGRGSLDQHADVKNVCKLRSCGICAVEQHDRFRAKLGRSPVQGICSVTSGTSQEVEGIPTRQATHPQRLDRFAFQPAPIYGV